jgi:exonuclease III
MSNERLEAILEELTDIHWDVLVLVETWREAEKEDFALPSGHKFYGSGGCKRRCGVGFLVHKRHACHSCIPISMRLAVLTLRSGSLKLRVFGVYMPDSSYAAHEVQVVYEQLQESLLNCSSQDWRCVVAGDLNAEVGEQDDLDDFAILGPGGLPVRNERGDLLLQWCTTHGLVLANTHFDTDLDKLWTWRNGSLRKQLDYILPDLQLFQRLRWCHVCPEVDTGSDHPAVAALQRALPTPPVTA